MDEEDRVVRSDSKSSKFLIKFFCSDLEPSDSLML